MVQKVEAEEEVTNVKAIRPDIEFKTDRERELLAYVATKITEARDLGMTIDSIFFCTVGTVNYHGKSQDGTRVHYWFDTKREIAKELSFMRTLTGYEINTIIKGMDDND